MGGYDACGCQYEHTKKYLESAAGAAAGGAFVRRFRTGAWLGRIAAFLVGFVYILIAHRFPFPDKRISIVRHIIYDRPGLVKLFLRLTRISQIYFDLTVDNDGFGSAIYRNLEPINDKAKPAHASCRIRRYALFASYYTRRSIIMPPSRRRKTSSHYNCANSPRAFADKLFERSGAVCRCC